MTTPQIIEVAVAAALIVGAALLYHHRGRADPTHGIQSAVLLLAIGLIMLIHGLGMLEYRPASAGMGIGGWVAQ